MLLLLQSPHLMSIHYSRGLLQFQAPISVAAQFCSIIIPEYCYSITKVISSPFFPKLGCEIESYWLHMALQRIWNGEFKTRKHEAISSYLPRVLGSSYLKTDGNVNFQPFTSVALAKRSLLNKKTNYKFSLFGATWHSKTIWKSKVTKQLVKVLCIEATRTSKLSWDYKLIAEF